MTNTLLDRHPWVPAASAGVLAAVITRLILRNGIFATPDSWAYWEGSISLLQNQRYEWFGGESLSLWPPLYAIFLAIVQRIAEPSGLGLIWSSTFLAAMSSFAWSLYAISLTRQSLLTRDREIRVSLLACFFIGVFVPITTVKLLAQTLSIGLTGLIYWLAIRKPVGQTSRVFVVSASVMGAVQALALLTHNAMICILPAIALVLMAHRHITLPTRLIALALNGGITLAPWLAVRIALQQGGSHPVALGGQIFSTGAYLQQTALTLGQFFFSNGNTSRGIATLLGTGLALASLAAWWTQRNSNPPVWRALTITLVGYLSLLALFCWTEVFNPMSGRFLWAVPLSVVPPMLIFAGRRPTWQISVLFLLLCAFPMKRSITFAVQGRLHEQVYADTYQTSFIIYPRYVMSTRSATPSPARGHLIRPPSYPWQKRFSDIGPANRPKDVKLLPADSTTSVP